MLRFQHDHSQIIHHTALHHDPQMLFSAPRAHQQQKVAHNL